MFIELIFNVSDFNWIKCFCVLEPQTLATYFNDCLQTGQNICIESGAIPSTSLNFTDQATYTCLASSSALTATSCNDQDMDNTPSTSTAVDGTSRERSCKLAFLCGKEFIYAVKQANHPWHYFEESDSMSSKHSSLPASIQYGFDWQCERPCKGNHVFKKLWRSRTRPSTQEQRFKPN